MPFRFNPITKKLDLVDVTSMPPGAVSSLTGDSGGAVGPTANNINILGNPDIEIAGNPGTSTLQLTNLTKSSPYIVGPTNQFRYQVIQDAIDDAHAQQVLTSSQQSVLIYPGTYTENLTLYTDVFLIGVVAATDVHPLTIVGTHTPPTTGNFASSGIFWQGTTAVFQSNAVGSCNLDFYNTIFEISGSGYSLDIPNWTGGVINFYQFFQTDTGSNGWINLGGGAGTIVVSINAAIGLTPKNVTALFTGPVEFDNMFISIKCSYSGSGNYININGACLLLNTHTFNDSVFCTLVNSSMQTEAEPAITQQSVGTLLISNTHIDSSSNPVITGTGSGIITLGGISFTDGKNIANTLTLSGGTGFIAAQLTNNGVILGTGPLPLAATAAGTNGQVLIGATSAAPAFGTLTSSDSSISFTTGANTLSLQVASGTAVGKTITGDTGGALSPTAGNWNILGGIGCSTAGSGSTLTVNVAGGGLDWSVVTVNTTFTVNTGTIANKAGTLAMALPATSAVGDIISITGINTALGWQITQAANQQIFFGTSSTTLGATGTLTSSATRDTITMVCVVANLTWNIISSIGNPSVV